MNVAEKRIFCDKVAHYLSFMFHFDNDVAFYIGCQFGLESNFGTSKLALEHFNFCGMKRPLVRISTAKVDSYSKTLKFASYYSLVECVFDFVLCLQYHKPSSSDFDTISHYCAFIKDWYCPEKDYIDKINSIYSQFKSLKNGK